MRHCAKFAKTIENACACRINRAAARPIAIGAVLEVRPEDRLQHDLGGGLNHPIPDRRDPSSRLSLPVKHPSADDAISGLLLKRFLYRIAAMWSSSVMVFAKFGARRSKPAAAY